MGDIPKPDSSILLKNIFNESSSNTNANMPQTNNTVPSSSTNKRTLDSLIEEPYMYGDSKRSRSDSIQQQDDTPVALAPRLDEHDDDDDSLVDAHLLSAAVVRRPFT